MTGTWLHHPGAQAVCRMLTDAGHQALFVGGCVRNDLLNAPVGDIDIATDAHPDKVISLAGKAGLKAIPTGIEHGTITVVAHDVPHEVTTFRKDVETDGRRAIVSFTSDPSVDAARRDFTMNALYATPDGEIVDPLGGLDDLRARRVRFIGDAAQRMREDYLRILRYFRFLAWYGDRSLGTDADTLAEIAAHLDGLDQLADERITAEFVKLLRAPDPAPVLGVMHEVGVLPRCLPAAHVPSLAAYLHLAQEAAPEPFLPAKLAALRAPEGGHRLRLDKATARDWERVRKLAENGSNPAEMGYRHGAGIAIQAMLVRAALTGHADPDAAAEAARGAAASFPVTAQDLMPRFKGKALGEKLREIEARWIASDFTLDRDALLS
ncbi:CCA tRNA nucleotidyltransferase [Pseudaestuariivita atlantica]|uniref:CCA tRNA nucleotidyltransferase n=1 Tax=Pseudaestuariivita atlantica TaxID=1317121 RepID=UPI0030FE7644